MTTPVQRPGFFAALAAVTALILLARVVRRGPLLGRRARVMRPWELGLFAASLAALVFHCASMFAPDVVAALGLDAPAAITRDLDDPVGQLAYWAPAVTAVVAIRRLWWPGPVVLSVAAIAVGWTMYVAGFTLDEHLATIAVAVIAIALITAALVKAPARSDRTRPRAAEPA